MTIYRRKVSMVEWIFQRVKLLLQSAYKIKIQLRNYTIFFSFTPHYKLNFGSKQQTSFPKMDKH